MAQKTDLNVSPYYDDFDKNKNFNKVLFKPGYPVQARELTTLQSILQSQIESFGNNIFKEGSLVIPGSITYDNQFSAVKLNSINLGVDISTYIKSFIGKTITGQSSGVTASVQYVSLPSDSDLVEYVTIYVKYINVGFDSQTTIFQDGESLIADENVTYGNTTIVSGTTFASLISLNSTSTGSAVSIDDGVYFVRGSFINVSKQTIILDYYTNTPSYRIGLIVSESVVNAKDDPSLYDNAKGFTNFASPGADRFKISLTLDKKSLTDLNDTDFIELLRVDNGRIKKTVNKTEYNVIRDYIAERTYDESGHYAVDKFTINLLECLNDRIDNDGVYLENEITDQGNIPSDNLICAQISPGKAYVSGYDVEFDSIQSIDIEKPRDTENVSNFSVPFEMGHLLRINNVSGFLKENEKIDLKSNFKGDSPFTIGQARVYTFNLTDAAYSGNSTQWDLYLYDIQTYTNITFNRSVTASEIPTSSFIKGKSSGATGFVVLGANSSSLNLSQTSGIFVNGEQVIINGIESPLIIKNFTVYSSKDIKSVSQSGHSGFQSFSADLSLKKKKLSNGITEVRISSGTVTSPGKLFSGISIGDIFSTIENDKLKYNEITNISADLSSFTISGITTVSGVFDGSIIGDGNYTPELRYSEIKNSENAYLYAKLPENNISSVDLSNSQLLISKQITGETTDSSGVLTFNTSATGIDNVVFESFDQERYGIGYSGSGIGTITSDAFSIDTSTNTVTIRGLLQNQSSNTVVNTTLKKTGIKSKIKKYIRSSVKVVNLSKFPQSGSVAVGSGSSSIPDGLIYNPYYGLRVQDEEISLDVPDVSNVLAIYESTGSNDPTLDQLEFISSSQVDTNTIIGENIIGSESGAIARIVLNSSASSVSSNHLAIVYLNDERFLVGERVTFTESNVESTIQSIIFGKYKNITNNFVLDKGQKDEYYDYSKLVRIGSQSPEKRLLIVYDHYIVPSSDDGDVFTVLSYDRNRYSKDIPRIGKENIRASDVLDFRPRVQNNSSTTKSPFAFESRVFTSNSIKYNLKPGESSILSYDFYLPRIDQVYLDKFGNVVYKKGSSSKNPISFKDEDNDLMNIAEIYLPAYLYNIDDAMVNMIDNKRYTMKDIGNIEDRLENLENITSLSLLEINTESLRIEDSSGNIRFKSGIFVDDFSNDSLSDKVLSKISIKDNSLRPYTFSNTLKQRPLPSEEISESNLDLSQNYNLLDPNIQKTGNLITLKYDSVKWIEQTLATNSENVNTFRIVELNGIITLSPKFDNKTRVINIPSRSRINQTIIDSKYISSRNISFFGRSLKPFARHYHFFDNHSNLDFVPKLIEIANSPNLVNSGSSNSSFRVGETIFVYHENKKIGKFRLASSNHKEGQFNSPTRVYTTNPYSRVDNIPVSYSQSSKTINIDLNSLSAEDQGSFYGYVKKGAKIVGQTSKSIAYVKDLKLIADNNGDLFGSIFIKDPYADPTPNPRILVGKKTFTLSSSLTNRNQTVGGSLISRSDALYYSNSDSNNLITKTTSATRISPLAQSFYVGGDIEIESAIGQNDDANGVFLTAVDLFFAKKPSNDIPIIIQIRKSDLGIPTLYAIGNSKVLLPEEINVSDNGETPTRVIFDEPIFLPPGKNYSLVLLSSTDEYEVWTARINERTINTKDKPPEEAIIYSKRFGLGGLFKSQNGYTWNSIPESDLKFNFYKAKFTSNVGIAHFGNPPLDESNGYVKNLLPNPLTTFPKKINIGITTINEGDSLIGILTSGRRIGSGNNILGSSAVITSVGSSVSSVGITTGGLNYPINVVSETVDTYNIIGNGSGLKLNITTNSSGTITGISHSTTDYGTGYKVGDAVGIVTSSTSTQTGRNSIVTITAISGIDKLYLTNVQGQTTDAFQVGTGLSYYGDDGNLVSLGSTFITSSTLLGGLNSGNILKVNHFNHGMYATNNKLKLTGVESDIAPTYLTEDLQSTTISGGYINVENSSNFSTFEGISVGSGNTGYVKIGDEVIGYTNPSGNQLEIVNRGVEGIIETHTADSPVMKYEFSGISLRRINNIVHDIYDQQIKSDSYYIEIDRSSNGKDRSGDDLGNQYPELSFTSQLIGGGSKINASENIIFNKINPKFNIILPGKDAQITATIRTTSGTSIDGTETSFQVLNEVTPVTLNQVNTLDSVRMVCSRINELENSEFNNISGRRSFTSALTLTNNGNENISPIINLNGSNIEFLSDVINNPIANFASDSSVNSITNDPHSAIYISKVIRISQPASSLKVLFTAYRPSSSDIRVLYGLVRDDSSEIEQEFELFPGYENLQTTSDGDLKVINPSLNSGKSDFKVPVSQFEQFLEYEYTANDLPDFSGYRIKIIMSGTNQANVPIVKNLRTIALK